MKNLQQRKDVKMKSQKIGSDYESPEIQVIDIRLETGVFSGSDNTTPGFEIE